MPACVAGVEPTVRRDEPAARAKHRDFSKPWGIARKLGARCSASVGVAISTPYPWPG